MAATSDSVRNSALGDVWALYTGALTPQPAPIEAQQIEKVQAVGSYVFRKNNDGSSQYIPQNGFRLSEKKSFLKELSVSGSLREKAITQIQRGEPAEITLIDFSSYPKLTNPEFFEFIQRHPNIQGVNVSGCYLLTDEAFTCLIGLEDLQYFSCSDCTGITEVGLSRIPMKNMRVLEMRFMRIGVDLLLTMLTEASYLEFLDLYEACSNLDDRVLALMSKRTRLEYLNLSYCSYDGTTKGLKDWGALSRLRFFGSPQYNDEVDERSYLEMLGNLNSLRILHLRDCLHDLSALQGLTQSSLEELVVTIGGATRNEIESLPATLKKFETDRDCHDEGFYLAVGRLTQLEVLNIQNICLDGAYVRQYWGSVTQLKEISFQFDENDALITICQQNPGLTRISCDDVTGGVIPSIAALRHLTHLRLIGEFDPAKLFDGLARRRVHSPLRVLDISTTRNELDAQDVWDSLVPFARTLRKVDVSGLSLKIEDEEAFKRTLVKFTKLTSLKHMNYHISLEACGVILSHMRQLRVLELGGDGRVQSSLEAIFNVFLEMRELQALTLMRFCGVKNKDFGKLSHTTLSELQLIRVKGFDDGVVPELERSKGLTSFSVSYVGAEVPLSDKAEERLKRNLQLRFAEQDRMY